jgi:hypothetical protein
MKKVWIGFITVFILMEIVSFLLHSVILGQTYMELKDLFRPDMERLWWVYQVLMVIGAFFFTFIFSKGWEGKGIMEGVRYGLYIGIWMGTGMAYGTYAMINIPYSLAMTWFICSIVEYIIYGIALTFVFGKKTAPAV